MRYHHEKPQIYKRIFGKTYVCNHPVYNRCTLYKIGDYGLAVIQQYYDSKTKKTEWKEVEAWIANELYIHPDFKKYFDKRSGLMDENGLYPTVTVRQIMWALRMKPIKRERWETVFDRKEI